MEVEQESIVIDVSKERRLPARLLPLTSSQRLFPTLTHTVTMQGKYERVCAPCRYPANRMNFGPPPNKVPRTKDYRPGAEWNTENKSPARYTESTLVMNGVTATNPTKPYAAWRALGSLGHSNVKAAI